MSVTTTVRGQIVARRHLYTYRDALADGVCRPVVFAAYTGVARWRNSATGALSDLDEQAHGSWVPTPRGRSRIGPGGWRWIRPASGSVTSSRRRTPGSPTCAMAGRLACSRTVVGQRPGRCPCLRRDHRGGHRAPRGGGGVRRPRFVVAHRGVPHEYGPWIVAVRQVSEGTDIPAWRCWSTPPTTGPRCSGSKRSAAWCVLVRPPRPPRCSSRRSAGWSRWPPDWSPNDIM